MHVSAKECDAWYILIVIGLVVVSRPFSLVLYHALLFLKRQGLREDNGMRTILGIYDEGKNIIIETKKKKCLKEIWIERNFIKSY